MKKIIAYEVVDLLGKYFELKDESKRLNQERNEFMSNKFQCSHDMDEVLFKYVSNYGFIGTVKDCLELRANYPEVAETIDTCDSCKIRDSFYLKRKENADQRTGIMLQLRWLVKDKNVG